MYINKNCSTKELVEIINEIKIIPDFYGLEYFLNNIFNLNININIQIESDKGIINIRSNKYGLIISMYKKNNLEIFKLEIFQDLAFFKCHKDYIKNFSAILQEVA